MQRMMRLPAALALAAALLVALAAPAGAAKVPRVVPVTGTVINSNGLTGTFRGTFAVGSVSRDAGGGRVVRGTLTGTAAIGEAAYPLTDQPFAAPATFVADADCTTLTVTFGRASLGVQDLALALDPVTLPVRAWPRAHAHHCGRK